MIAACRLFTSRRYGLIRMFLSSSEQTFHGVLFGAVVRSCFVLLKLPLPVFAIPPFYISGSKRNALGRELWRGSRLGVERRGRLTLRP